LPKNRRWVCSISRPHGIFVARLRIEAGVSFGGAESPFFRSRCRWPMICRSTVITSAEHFASFARANSRFMKSSSLSV
jgi:hypothetical protein